MRSRTEMVTTTFVDSEEDYSDDNDSEEDWRPSASNKNGKKSKQQKCSGGGGPSKRGRKRKGNSGQPNKNSKRKAIYEESEDDDKDELSDDDYDYSEFEAISGPSRKKPSSLPPKKQFSDKNSSTSGNDDAGDTLNLLVYVKDLTGTDLKKNSRLCLWRKDSNNLLQKYIRVKTTPEQYIFTSSSVYSSFDDKRISDFYDIKVTSIDSSNRRVKIINPSELQKIYLKAPKNKNNSDDDILSDEKSDIGENEQIYVKHKKNLKKICEAATQHHQDEDDDEEEVEEENDEEEDEGDLEDDDDDIEEDDEADDA
ncbi:glutamic acid-rich protein isoform X1 [Lucilia sericata]|nr:glutamic acid-rich protein isoform X1 [Lucilia sericata]XP_037813428.1 glutamic acid-rich protein isoform X1 [Lucilia sericata]XP_037813429.1 glutamic acid-rich protein isoform X1 [Lucilia sericata]XP_037813431.1 glutamic acid-rich protein isoform X1 [Lucilia sericata]